ncbi:YicC/YloC family endoribonuclease [Methylomarinum sp. Ch1-1]|uniref:YicC/YloC family endoribonuclease n=1 Tax=Methylomarinum roseum TaxID=3067653 RepID=A0AAU7NWM4_9GAMM|nr:YicC/YloC family endoribonuclease [Methylomarinum sp. Ch1-1]MDP4522573.1 YicC/YloC family endoribonuclease [Methylomarinum sp. Ch1-1]
MIRSMTAFAGAEAEIANLLINCELRSVNHRYCDISLKLPERLRFAESDMRVAISNRLKRGKIECTLNYKKQGTEQSYAFNNEAVKGLLTATAAIEQHMERPQAFSALEVLAFPGIQQEAESDRESLQRGINDLLDRALSDVLAAREREGEQLGLLIEDRCGKMRLLVEQAQARMPEVLRLLREKLTERIAELVAEPDFDRLEQELVMQAQKLDVAEELDRLNTHIDEVSRILTQDEPVGRRLDFLMQEMNREANTLGSKSADKEMTAIAIDLKVLIEQMREQVQNIE